MLIEAAGGVVHFIAVDDIDDALARAAAAGGVIVVEKRPVPAMGWSARYLDSQGNLVGVFQLDPCVQMVPGGLSY